MWTLERLPPTKETDMTDTSSPTGTNSPTGTTPMHAQPRRYAEPTGWTGWITFAAFMMVTIGILHVIQGVVALFKDSYYIVAKSGLVVSADYTSWGWTHIILGAVVGI